MAEKEEMEARREVEDTAARREARASLEHVLSRKRCPNCGKCAWRVYRTKGKVRFIECKGCKYKDKVVAKKASE